MENNMENKSEGEKKPVYHFTMSGITNGEGSENFTVQFNALEGETEEEVISRVDKAKKIFDHVCLTNNKKAQEVAERIKQQQLKARTDLPEKFN